MDELNLLSLDKLHKATLNIVDNGWFADRIIWWLYNGNATERWFQYEWAYQLAKILQEDDYDYGVACEQKYIDVVLYPLSGHQSGETAAGIEIKFYGNWWVKDKEINGAVRDIKKVSGDDNVSGYKYPAVALIFYLVVDPIKKDNRLKWIRDQIDNKHGLKHNEFIDLLEKQSLKKAESRSIPIKLPEDLFTSSTLYIYAFYNDSAVDC